jgi:UDP-glucose 4-epimerase
MNILVTGGAGYIGSHVVQELYNNHNIIIYDDLSKGHKESLPKNIKFIQANLSETEKLDQVFQKYKIDSVIHLASFIEVNESVNDPKKYFENNVLNGLNLLNSMIKNNVKKIIYSSSAGIYGNPKKIPIDEDSETIPNNPYGLTKLMFEQILKKYNQTYNLNSVSLRYFNAAGAHISSEIGEDHKPESHLIPLVLQTALNLRPAIKIFGTDYQTKDGTAIRDYIHVTDLAHAHILALDNLENNEGYFYYNLGNEQGFSVKEIIDITSDITNIEIPIEKTDRRLGDPAILIASSKKIKQELKWKPKYNDIKIIIKTAWQWHQQNPNGYSSNKFSTILA